MSRVSLLFLASMAACGSPSSDATASDRAESALGAALVWVGDTELRYDGYAIPARLVMSGRALDVTTQTWPMGAATKTTLFWKVGCDVRSAPMTIDAESVGTYGDNTRWRASIPAGDLANGAPVSYWIRAEDTAAGVLWDSRGGANYIVTPHDEVVLFDADADVDAWRMAGSGAFGASGGALVAHPADGLGLYWCAMPTPPDFELTLEYRLADGGDNSGVFLRFPDPDAFAYDNRAWVGVDFGLEVQIDDTARPDGADMHRTGAIYAEPEQTYTRVTPLPPGQWNAYRIRVVGQTYTVWLDGAQSTTLAWPGDPARPTRGLPSAPGAPRFVGVQSHTGEVAFRNVRLRRI